jgi:DNA polymerase-3 subunit delta'
LLAGPRGVGKQQFALRLSAWLLCEAGKDEPCGQCRGCIQFAAGTHPNFFLLEPEPDKRDISIEAVREVCEKLSLTAHYGGAKIALFRPADALNANGVNALLKTIEEPAASTYLLLLTDRPGLLLPTLRSRCQALRFAIPPADQASDWLRSQGHQDPSMALQVANGAPLRALALLKDGLIDRYARWQRSVESVAAGKESPLAIAVGMDKPEATAFVDWLIGWLAALQKKLLASQERWNGLDPAAVDSLLQRCIEALKRLQLSAPPPLTIESIMISLSQLSRSPIKEMRA